MSESYLHIRDTCLEINKAFDILLDGENEVINAGSAPNAADGDTLMHAFGKIHLNLKELLARENRKLHFKL